MIRKRLPVGFMLLSAFFCDRAWTAYGGPDFYKAYAEIETTSGEQKKGLLLLFDPRHEKNSKNLRLRLEKREVVLFGLSKPILEVVFSDQDRKIAALLGTKTQWSVEPEKPQTYLSVEVWPRYLCGPFVKEEVALSQIASLKIHLDLRTTEGKTFVREAYRLRELRGCPAVSLGESDHGSAEGVFHPKAAILWEAKYLLKLDFAVRYAATAPEGHRVDDAVALRDALLQRGPLKVSAEHTALATALFSVLKSRDKKSLDKIEAQIQEFKNRIGYWVKSYPDAPGEVLVGSPVPESGYQEIRARFLPEAKR